MHMHKNVQICKPTKDDSKRNLISQERCDHGLMSKRAETLETESNTSSPDWWQCIEEI